jgi:FkbM family methyltransferase
MFRLERAPTKTLADQVLIYGAGNTGKSVCTHLERMGVSVVGFVDQYKRGRSDYCDRPLFSLNEVHGDLLSKQVVISIHNREVDLVAVIKTLKECGFSDLITMVDYANANPADKTFRYFLSPSDVVLAQEDKIRKFESLLSDNKSKQLYQQLLMFRLGHGYNNCPVPEGGEQYVPSDIRKWHNPMRLVDCGAYDGDSIEIYQKANYQVESVVAFEPDLNNYKKLVKNCNALSAICLPCGVGETASVVRFDSGSGEGSRVSGIGDTVIQICSIDETLENYSPSLIKMDIEGAEYEAIQGAKRTIAKHRPGLAISAYHTPDDLWRLALLINDIVDGYDFYLRCHGYSSFDTVLYVLPR